MSHGGDQNYIGAVRIDDYTADVARVTQPDIAPGFAAIAGFIDTIAIREIRAPVGLAAARINNVGIRWSKGQRADGSNGLAVKDRLPGHAAIGGPPHASAHAAKVVGVGLALHAAHGDAAATAKRANHSPAHSS